MTSYAAIDEIKTERLSRGFSGNYNTEMAKLNIKNENEINWNPEVSITTKH